MKRILFISLSNLLLLTACGTSASKNIPSDTQISNSIDSTISTNEKNSPVETSDIKVSTSAKKQGKETVSTSPLFQTNSELASSSSSANNDDSFAFTPN
ncbi:hypothetical protein LOS25_03950 [Enterococcus faecium]|nr:hypothetical protein [Enterococcus faecium]MCC9084815.1 hypothetical protein [Enterococcus faecium]